MRNSTRLKNLTSIWLMLTVERAIRLDNQDQVIYQNTAIFTTKKLKQLNCKQKIINVTIAMGNEESS